MNRFAIGLAALCLATTPALAQQPPAQAPAQAPAQQNVERTKNGNWTVECGDAQNRGRVCQMVQNITDKKSGKPILQAVVHKLAGPDKPVMSLVAPLGVWLRPGLAIKVDGGEPSRIAFEACSRAGCVAHIQLSVGLVNALKKGTSAAVTMQDIRRRKADVPVSLSGFTKSYNAL